jgi:8-oxo-dGTP pyrophosphatase MutT (NUDIX family)
MSRYSYHRSSGASGAETHGYSATNPVPYELYNKNPKKFLQVEQSRICVQQMILCFHEKEPCILLCERSGENNMHKGNLTLPGGKIDDQNVAQSDFLKVSSNNITIADFLGKHSSNVKREVDEETGIKLTHLFGINDVYQKPNMSIFMYGTIILGEIKNINMDSEISNVYLIPVENLLGSFVSPETRYYDKKTGTELYQAGEFFYEDKAATKLFHRSNDIIGIEDNIVIRSANKFIKLTNQNEPTSNDKHTIREGGIIIDVIQNYFGKDATHVKAKMREMMKLEQQTISEAQIAVMERSR